MNLRLLITNSETNTIVFLETLFFTFGLIFQLFLIWVGKMSEGKDFFGIGTTGVGSGVDLYDIREFIRVELLGNWNSILEALTSVDIHFVPGYLAGQWHHIVSVGIGYEYATRLEILRGRVKTLRTEFIITKTSQEL